MKTRGSRLGSSVFASSDFAPGTQLILEPYYDSRDVPLDIDPAVLKEMEVELILDLLLDMEAEKQVEIESEF